MKIRFSILAGCILLMAVITSCYNRHSRYNSNDVSVTVRESDDEYQLSASFSPSKTKRVQSYIDEYTGRNGIFRSGNVEIDAATVLEDNIRVYIKSHPGRLKIKFDKDGNSEESYERVKEMCEGIKDILTEE